MSIIRIYIYICTFYAHARTLARQTQGHKSWARDAPPYITRVSIMWNGFQKRAIIFYPVIFPRPSARDGAARARNINTRRRRASLQCSIENNISNRTFTWYTYVCRRPTRSYIYIYTLRLNKIVIIVLLYCSVYGGIVSDERQKKIKNDIKFVRFY